MHQRNYKMDNIRFLLIFFVLLGHFIELFSGTFSSNLYKIIYSFHMPAFLFLTGFFARFNRKKIILNLIYPYILFQILYLLFATFIIDGDKQINIQFSTPYWLLWYLLVTIFYYLLLPVFDFQTSTLQIVMLLCSILISTLLGFDNSIGYYASLARFFSFLPFFLAGHYAAHLCKRTNYCNKSQNLPLIITLLGLFLFFCSIYIAKNTKITAPVLYGSYSYEAASYSPIIKIGLIFVGFICIFRPNCTLIPIVSA